MLFAAMHESLVGHEADPAMSAVYSLSGVNRTWRGHRQTDANGASPTSGLIACKAGFVSFLTRRSRKVLGFKHQDVRSCPLLFSLRTGVRELSYSRQPPQSGHGLLTLKLEAAVRRFSGITSFTHDQWNSHHKRRANAECKRPARMDSNHLHDIESVGPSRLKKF